MKFETSTMESTTREASMLEVEVLEGVETMATRALLLLLWVKRVFSSVKLLSHFCWSKDTRKKEKINSLIMKKVKADASTSIYQTSF